MKALIQGYNNIIGHVGKNQVTGSGNVTTFSERNFVFTRYKAQVNILKKFSGIRNIVGPIVVNSVVPMHHNIGSMKQQFIGFEEIIVQRK